MSKFDRLKPYLLLVIILLLAYLPLSTFHFAMKNDAFSDNFPNKFFLSNALRSRYLPLWNPYLNFGFPIYADPGFAFWNPITWFFAAVPGYTAYTLTIEVLVYLYLAGAMIYRLGKYLQFTVTTSLAMASMYMCSGFFVGELQHINFLTSAAFLPLVLQQTLQLFYGPGYKTAFFASTGYYLILAGGHPAMPIALVYFFIVFGTCLFLFNQDFRVNWNRILRFQVLSFFLFVVIASPVLYNYLVLLPDYARNSPVDQMDAAAMYTGFSPSSYLSFLYPFSTVKNTSFLTDDLSMRNIYFSVGGFVLAATQVVNKNYLVRSLAITGIFMLVLCCGGTMKAAIYSNLPLLEYVKTNGEYRVFVILALCILAGKGLSRVNADYTTYSKYRSILKALAATGTALLLATIIIQVISNEKPFQFNGVLDSITIKKFIDSLSFSQTFIAALVFNLVCIVGLLLVKRNPKKIVVIVVADLVLNGIIYLPFSGVGRITLPEIQSLYDKGGEKIEIPPLVKIKDIEALSPEMTGLTGSWSYYNKKIGTTVLTDYPSNFQSTEQYFQSELPQFINDHPYIFLKKQTDTTSVPSLASPIEVQYFSPTKIRIKVLSSQPDTLVLLQNYYRFWNARVDGVRIPVRRSYITFMELPITRGPHLVEFYYEDTPLVAFVIISLTSLLVMYTIIIWPFRRFVKKKPEIKNH